MNDLLVYFEKKKEKMHNSEFFLDFQYQGAVKSTDFRVFEDFKFKISEGYNQN